jgi:hypothetical protein
MKAELLLLRLEVLKRGIRDVQEVLEAGNELRATIKRAQDNVDAAWWFVNNILEVANNQKVIDALEVLPTSTGVEWKNELRKIKDGLDHARQEGVGLTGQLQSAKDRLSEIDARLVCFSQDFGVGVGRQMKELGRQIDELAREVEKQPESADSWKRYFEDIQPTATRLFTEYLYLLGGVTIRERGLVIKALAEVCHLDELCMLAEWHVAWELSLCLDWDKPTYVAVPGRDLVSEISAWPILRLGFVSWSIWGLPLEGHEFGKLVADVEMPDQTLKQRKQWKPYLTEFGGNGTRVLIADSIAAWAEGPAYACALLFLALNPSRAQGGSSTRNAWDADRAELVLATLRGRTATGPVGGRRTADGYEYTPFIDQLEETWNDACHLGGKALPAERKRLLQELPGLVEIHLGLQKPFGLKDWRLADDVLAKLISGQEVPLEPACGVRHLANAAWRGRFLATDGIVKARAGNAQASLDQLEQRAMKAGVALSSPPRGVRPSASDTSSLKDPRPLGSP